MPFVDIMCGSIVLQKAFLIVNMEKLKSSSHSKHLLMYHLIFVCKYRKQLFCDSAIVEKVKELSNEITKRKNVIIHYMEVDKDHIHYMIETKPTINLSQLVNNMKSYITYHIWKYFEPYLQKHFWKEKTFFSDGYFITSIGNVSEETLKKYIEEQGS